VNRESTSSTQRALSIELKLPAAPMKLSEGGRSLPAPVCQEKIPCGTLNGEGHRFAAKSARPRHFEGKHWGRPIEGRARLRSAAGKRSISISQKTPCGGGVYGGQFARDRTKRISRIERLRCKGATNHDSHHQLKLEREGTGTFSRKGACLYYSKETTFRWRGEKRLLPYSRGAYPRRVVEVSLSIWEGLLTSLFGRKKRAERGAGF